MSHGKINIISEMLQEINHEYLGGCIAWADKEKNNAWSDAVDELDSMLLSGKTSDEVEAAKRKYLLVVKPLMSEYKKLKNIDNSDNFISEIQKQIDLT